KVTDLTAKPLMTISGHEGPIRGVVYLPGGERVVSCSADKTVRIWDVEKGEQKGTSMVHGGCVRGLAVTKDGKRILSGGGKDTRITIWDVKRSGNIKHSINAGKWVQSLCFSPNREKLACSAFNQVHIIQVYDVDSGKLVLGPIKGHERAINCVLWSLDGSKLFSASNDGSIRCWNSET
ncbi:hypothetical protein PAXINDRAFT_42952, partial [Paxillus involutus ATCC 200175]